MERPPADDDELRVAEGKLVVMDQSTTGTAPVQQQRRGNVSVARWAPEMRMAEVLVRRGKLWGGMGVIRNSTLYCHVEEAVYLVEQGSLLLLQGEGEGDDTTFTCPDVYNLLLVPSNGCLWDMYQVYCHLKRLGYVVGRHKIPWSTSAKRRSPEKTENTEIQEEKIGDGDGDGDGEFKNNAVVLSEAAADEDRPGGYGINDKGGAARLRFSCADMIDGSNQFFSIWSRLFVNLNIWKPNHQEVPSKLKNEEKEKEDEDEHEDCCFDVKFDVYQPNSRFRKTLPGCPIFNLCIVIGKPPPLEQCKLCQLRESQIEKRPPLKFASVIYGHVFIFSFTPCTLPTLP